MRVIHTKMGNGSFVASFRHCPFLSAIDVLAPSLHLWIDVWIFTHRPSGHAGCRRLISRLVAIVCLQSPVVGHVTPSRDLFSIPVCCLC